MTLEDLIREINGKLDNQGGWSNYSVAKYACEQAFALGRRETLQNLISAFRAMEEQYSAEGFDQDEFHRIIRRIEGSLQEETNLSPQNIVQHIFGIAPEDPAHMQQDIGE